LTPDLKEALAKHPDRVHEAKTEKELIAAVKTNLAKGDAALAEAEKHKANAEALKADLAKASRALVVRQADADDRSLADIESVLATALHGERNNVIEIGKLLIAAKSKVDHGQWLPWLMKHFGKSERTARNYMKAAEWLASKSATVADLKLRPGAFYWLASSGGTGAYGVDNGGWTGKRSERAAAFDQGVHLPEVREEVEAEVFALAKTKWVDGDDCDEVFKRAAGRAYRKKAKENKSARDVKRAADRAAERSAEPEPEDEPVNIMVYEDVVEQLGPPIRKDQIGNRAKLAEHGTTPEIEAQYNDVRRGNLRGMVKVLIQYSKNPDAFDGAVSAERLMQAGGFLLRAYEREIARAAKPKPDPEIDDLM
jgi:hypothetical protein